MAQINNIRTVSVPSIGKLPLAAQPGNFTPSGVAREHKGGRVAADGGYTESETPAMLDLNINLIGGVDLNALNAIKDEDITVRLANGEVHVLFQAFAENQPGVEDTKLTIKANVSERISQIIA